MWARIVWYVTPNAFYRCISSYLLVDANSDNDSDQFLGACTVMLSEYDHHAKKITHKSINACLMPLCHVDHKAITTLEGLGSVVGISSGI